MGHRALALVVMLGLMLGQIPPAAAAEITTQSSTTPDSTPSAAAVVRLILPVAYLSQMSEPAPSYWTASDTPYCAAATSIMVMRTFGVDLPAAPIATTFAQGRAGNITPDPGLDPAGVSHLMRSYGGTGGIHIAWDKGTMLNDLVGRLNWRAPVVAFTQGGNHAVTVYGYEALEGGAVTALYVADPYDGFMGRVAIESWLGAYHWMGSGFIAPGAQWQGGYIFATYKDYGPPAYNSRWQRQSAYPVVGVGETASFTVVFRNTGTGAWQRGAATEAHLGINGDDQSYARSGAAVGWLSADRPAMQTELRVEPGETATFTFQVRGVRSGTFQLHLRPVIDGLTWLDDDGVFAQITVR